MSASRPWLTGVDPLYRTLELWAAIERMDVRRTWCVITARAGREKAVQAELALAGWETYLPMQTFWAGNRRRRRRATCPLFARYLFAACGDGADVAATHDIVDLVSVYRIGGRSAVRIDLLARLMLAEAAHDFDLTFVRPRAPKRAWVCGQPVTVRAGSMAGMDGLIARVLGEREVLVRLPVALCGTDEFVLNSADLDAA